MSVSDSAPREPVTASGGHTGRIRDLPARRAVIGLVVVALAAATAGCFLGRGTGSASTTVSDTATPAVVLVAPEQRVLQDVLMLRGQVVPPATTTIVSGGAGRVTAAVKPGAAVTNGSVVAELDGEPVVALTGSRPYWRDMSIGSTGADVAQLEQQLTALGFDPGTTDARFTASTLAAWNALRVARGYQGDARSVGPSAAVVGAFDAGPLVQEVSGQVGDFVTAGADLFSMAVGGPLIRVPVPADETGSVTVGAAVSIEGSIPGTISAVETTDGATSALVTPATAVATPSPLVELVLAESGAESLVIPTLALHARSDGSAYVVLADRGDVDVTVDLVVGGEAAVTGDLAATDRVVLPGLDGVDSTPAAGTATATAATTTGTSG